MVALRHLRTRLGCIARARGGAAWAFEAGPGTGRFHPRRVHSLDFGEATTTMAWHGDPAMASLSITPGAALATGLHADDAVTVHGHQT
jgi:hypothetical protein